MLWLDNSLQARVALQKRALVFALVTVLILFIFQPFGTYESELTYKYLRLAGYGVATFLAVFIAGSIEILLSRHRHNILYYPYIIISLYIVVAALLNHSYFVVAIFGTWYWLNQLMFVFYVSAIAAFPVILMYFRHAKKGSISTAYKAAAQETELQQAERCTTDHEIKTKESVEEQLSEQGAQAQGEAPVLVQIVGENKADVLSVSLTDIVLLKSADNYCEIVTKKDNEVTTNLLRISLTKALTQLPENTLIVRCHRSFAVNLSQVKSTSGNASGLKLEMLLADMIVPVSRTFVSDIKHALSFAPKPCQSSRSEDNSPLNSPVST
ncbi:LytTR family transcriptional regulator DNA-binding domain-containing protein [Thalassotalea euphylliae]|uniref:LytTR family transcriptional regulator DNA-binding domain-containing protein n=1 Tax=Thalassotalea euphylliae TaxID=1655234 RepID=UPI00362CFD21